jgi:glycosyltransferase involved in cell wall biosynthesis/O-antigen/teichoic acid export membrane protein
MSSSVSNKLSSNESLAASIGKNAVFGAFSQAVYIASRFVTVPFVIAHLGLGGYGIWSIILTVAGYMRFGTAGVKSAFIKYVGEATGTGDYAKASKLLSTGSITMLGLSVVGLVPLALFSRHLAGAAGVPPEFLSAAATSITILAFTYLLSNFGAAYEAIVMGAQRIDLTRKFNTVLTLCETVAILVVLYLHLGLVALSTIIASSEFLYIVLSFIASLKVLPQVKIRLSDFTKSTYRELARFAGSYQLLNLLEVFYLSVWPIVMLKSFGAEAAGISALALRIVTATLIGMDAFCMPIHAGAAMVFASDQGERARLFLTKAFKVTLLVSLLPLSFVAVFGARIIQAWTGQAGPLFAGAVMLIALTNLFRALLVLQVILYRSAGHALRDNVLHAIRITLALTAALFAKKLGFFGLLGAMSVIECAGVVFMFHVLALSFSEFRLRMLWKDAAKTAMASAAIVGMGAIFGSVHLPLHLPERLAEVVQLGQVALGCLLAAWPALQLTGTISSDEWSTILQAVLPGRKTSVTQDFTVQTTEKQQTTVNQLVGHPLISVVIPTFNRPKQTIEAIESVLAQTYSNLEILVVDDGSNERSVEALQQFIRQRTNCFPPIFILSQPNRGASAARNAGIAKARGEYIAFLDSDDQWFPKKLEWQLRAFELLKDGCGACYTDARLVNNTGLDASSFLVHGRRYEKEIGIDRYALRSFAGSFSGFWVSSLLVRADLIKQIGGFNPDISFIEDRDLNFRLALTTSIGYVNKQLIQSDRNPSPPGSNLRPWDRVDLQFLQQQRMYEGWLKMDAALPTDVRRRVERALGGLHSHKANWHLENKQYEEAREAVSTAVKYRRTVGTTLKWMLTWSSPVLARSLAPKTRPIGTGGHAS